MVDDKRKHLITVGRNIKRLREEKGWSLDELARRCGYTSENSRSTIQKIESGKNDVPVSKLKLIADALGTTPAILMGVGVSQTEYEKEKACELFEKCYGKESFTVVSKFLILDENDRAVISDMINAMLKREKYSVQDGLRNA